MRAAHRWNHSALGLTAERRAFCRPFAEASGERQIPHAPILNEKTEVLHPHDTAGLFLDHRLRLCIAPVPQAIKWMPRPTTSSRCGPECCST